MLGSKKKEKAGKGYGVSECKSNTKGLLGKASLRRQFFKKVTSEKSPALPLCAERKFQRTARINVMQGMLGFV